MLTERFLNIAPTLTSDSHSEEEAECDRISLLSSDRIDVEGGGVTYPNPCVFYHNNLSVSLLARNYVENHVAFFQNLGHSHAAGYIPFFSSYAALIVYNGKTVGALSLNSNMWP